MADGDLCGASDYDVRQKARPSLLAQWSSARRGLPTWPPQRDNRPMRPAAPGR
ncbi:hypothetical protein I545_6417 [Mycobacterium kansasii 662]|uniref:Uncharacterized protein n=1 Tax=Mycobacterium kansasii 662 TaxID=1299326 RepID=X7YLZ3_MYCKA|nr:hypothetical protein I545_6417 [Mycobacterium kansasii 662]